MSEPSTGHSRPSAAHTVRSEPPRPPPSSKQSWSSAVVRRSPAVDASTTNSVADAPEAQSTIWKTPSASPMHLPLADDLRAPTPVAASMAAVSHSCVGEPSHCSSERLSASAYSHGATLSSCPGRQIVMSSTSTLQLVGTPRSLPICSRCFL